MASCLLRLASNGLGELSRTSIPASSMGCLHAPCPGSLPPVQVVHDLRALKHGLACVGILSSTDSLSSRCKLMYILASPLVQLLMRTQQCSLTVLQCMSMPQLRASQ